MFMKRSTPKKLFVLITPCLSAACALLTLLATPAFAVDRTVPGAFPTIQAAVNASLPGDRILVSGGTYYENVVSTNANLQFLGKNSVWDGTLTNGTAGVCLTATGSNVVVQGFIFRAGQSFVAQVQLTGANCRVSKCSSRSSTALFLRITGNSAVVDNCSLYGLSGTAIQINGDDARVTKVKTRQCDNNVVSITGNRATVTGCNFALNEDSYSINIIGSRATLAQNTFVNCDYAINVSGTNNTVAKNKAVNLYIFLQSSGVNTVVDGNRATFCDSTFISVGSSAGAVIANNQLTYGGGTFASVTSSNAVITKNKGVNISSFLSLNGLNPRVEGNSATVCFGNFINIASSANAVVANNQAGYCGSTFISAASSNAVVANNKVGVCRSTFVNLNGDNARVENNSGVTTGPMYVTGDNVTVRGNKITDGFNDRDGLIVSSRTLAGGGLVEKNTIQEVAESGLYLSCHNVAVVGNRVTGAGTEGDESTCIISGNGNRLTNNVAISGGAHGFLVYGANNLLVKCSAIDAASDGFHIEGAGNTLLLCDAMLCSGEGLDNGGTGTTVVDCAFQKNRLDVANDGTFANIATFAADNTFTTGGPAQLPQVD
jgi:Right handed beta helix region